MNVIVDTGCANLSSVRFAVERLGYEVTISADPSLILSAQKVFLPGVGTVREAMKNLAQNQLIDVIKSVEAPLLGICLGMQILTEYSYEDGITENQQGTQCLGVIPGHIRKMQPKGQEPLPHMGWNQIQPTDHPLLKGIDNKNFFYFVHSYALPVSQYTLAQCDYGEPFSAVIGYKNFFGVQFHPERSSTAGAQLLQNFMEM